LPDLIGILILFAVGAVAAFINVNAGGGSSLTLPALIFLGLDPQLQMEQIVLQYFFKVFLLFNLLSKRNFLN